MRIGRAWGNPPDDPTWETVPRSPDQVKCNAATPWREVYAGRRPFFSWRRMGSTVLRSEMESAMRMIGAASLVAVMMLAGAPARADWVPPFKGNDTGGIIAYALGAQTDVRQLAVDHCARYGKVVKFLAVDPHSV